MAAKIIDRGRGPEIEGTRITVYDVVDYLKEDWRAEQIAAMFRLPLEDIEAAMDYIERHNVVVMADYRQIVARHQNVTYSPEVQAKLDRNHERFLAKVDAMRARQKANPHVEPHGGS